MKKYKIKIRSQKNSQSCVPLNDGEAKIPDYSPVVDYYKFNYKINCSHNKMT